MIVATPVEDALVFLQAQALGTIGTTLFRDHLPDDPDACTAVFSTSGGPSEIAFGSENVKWERPRCAVWRREARYAKDLARTNAWTAYKALGKIQAEIVNGTFYHFTHLLQAPFFLKDDNNERPIFVFNVEFEKEVAA